MTRFVVSVPTGDGSWRQHAWSDATYPGQTIQEWIRDTLLGLLNVDEAEEIADTAYVTFGRQPR
jgi:hypothetical protein